MSRYLITRAPDGEHWITLDALLQDVLEQLDSPQARSKDEAFYALTVVKTFLQSLVAEAQLADYLHPSKDDELPYKDTLQ
jgi:hypothetical protein